MSIKAFLRTFVLFSFVLAVSLAGEQQLSARQGPTVLGVVLPKEAIPVKGEPNRYYIKMKTAPYVVRYLRRVLTSAGIKFRVFAAVEHPLVAVWHVQSADPHTQWEGINVMLYKGRVEVFLIPRTKNRS